MSGAESPGPGANPAGGGLIRTLILSVSSGLFTGYIPFASGTWATALAILFYWPARNLNRWPSDGGSPVLYANLLVLLTAIAVWTSSYAEKIHGEKDPHKVVIDEIAGYFFTMILVPWSWPNAIAGFFLFRLFDVWKPQPIRGLQRLKGGVGIVIDDVLAGIYACVALHAGIWAWGMIQAG